MIALPDDVTAILVTRGNVDLTPILESLIFDDVVVWDNARERDLGAFGRYKAIDRARGLLIYWQDDDCLVPREAQARLVEEYDDGLLSNMDPGHNGGAYPLLALPGWGSLSLRDLPAEAFARWRAEYPDDYGSDDFLRVGCDIVFPVLTPSRMIDLGHENLPYAYGDDRTWRQLGYLERKHWYYDRALTLRGRG